MTALVAAGRAWLAGGLAGGLGSLGLLLLLLLLVAGVTQSMGAASVGFHTSRPHVGAAYLPQHYPQQLAPTYASAEHHGYQLAVVRSGWNAPLTAAPARRRPTTVSSSSTSTSTSTSTSPPPPLVNDTYGAYLQASGDYSYASSGSGSSSNGGGGGDSSEVPQLQLDYGVPLTDFLAGQASVNAASHHQLDTYPSRVTRANFSLPLISTDIPLLGDDYQDDGCARDEVRLRVTHRSYNRARPCQPLLERGDCQRHQWVVINEYTMMGECATRLCPDGYAFIVADGQCHDVHEQSLCQGNRRVYVTAFGEPRCDCPDGQYLDKYGTCRLLYGSEVCLYGQQLRFNAAFRLQCADTSCPRHKPVFLQGWCKAFGDPCGNYQFLLGLDTTMLEPKCFPADQLTAGGPPHVQAEAEREVTPTPPPPPPKPPVLFLHNAYLPPPGQRVQYARRQGLYAPPDRSSLAQWLGLGRRARPRRRRPPPPTPLLTPWSRLDIDHVTFVDSERVSSSQVSRRRQQQRRRRRRHRFRRQIVNKVPTLNVCRPGAMRGPNYKCRDKVLPESDSSRARAPVPPSNALICPPNQRLDHLGRCQARSRGLGK